MLTVPQFAARLGVTPGRIRQFLTEKRIKGAVKLGRDWLIPPNAHVRPLPMGRPKKASALR